MSNKNTKWIDFEELKHHEKWTKERTKEALKLAEECTCGGEIDTSTIKHSQYDDSRGEYFITSYKCKCNKNHALTGWGKHE
jgi:hypothetical protein